MTWAIRVENLSKQYRMGTAVTPAFDSVYQIIEQKLASFTRRFNGAPPLTDIIQHDDTNTQNSHLVLTPEQQIGCPEGHFWALRDVSFEIKEGERVGIVGKNGSGKSTLLKILSRITTPSLGQFHYRGRLVSLLEVGTGFHPDLSGRENIILNAKINGMSSKAINQVFDEIVEFSELGPQIDTPIKRYSSGMYMRLAFSVAAHLESEILIVDEVLAVGDAGFQKKCLNKMLEVSGKGRTLLFVSHDMNAISSLCTKALELSHGQVVTTSSNSEDNLITEQPETTIDSNANGLRSVKQAISDYIFDGGACAERLWSGEIAPHMANNSVVLRRVAVLKSSNDVSQQFDVSEDIKVEVQFDVYTPNVELNVHIYLTTLTGQRLFVSMDNLDIPKSIQKRTAGRYIEECLIKRNFLNEGTFRIEVVICTNPTSENYIAVPDAVSFSITDNLSSSSIRGDWIREWPDYPIRPRLSWSVKKSTEPADVSTSSL